MAASAGAAKPLAGLWSEQASVAGMGWEEPGAEAAARLCSRPFLQMTTIVRVGVGFSNERYTNGVLPLIVAICVTRDIPKPAITKA